MKTNIVVLLSIAVVATASVIKSSFRCGDPDFKGTWFVSIEVGRPDEDECFGYLVSPGQIVTSCPKLQQLSTQVDKILVDFLLMKDADTDEALQNLKVKEITPVSGTSLSMLELQDQVTDFEHVMPICTVEKRQGEGNAIIKEKFEALLSNQNCSLSSSEGPEIACKCDEETSEEDIDAMIIEDQSGRHVLVAVATNKPEANQTCLKFDKLVLPSSGVNTDFMFVSDDDEQENLSRFGSSSPEGCPIIRMCDGKMICENFQKTKCESGDEFCKDTPDSCPVFKCDHSEENDDPTTVDPSEVCGDNVNHEGVDVNNPEDFVGNRFFFPDQIDEGPGGNDNDEGLARQPTTSSTTASSVVTVDIDSSSISPQPNAALPDDSELVIVEAELNGNAKRILDAEVTPVDDPELVLMDVLRSGGCAGSSTVRNCRDIPNGLCSNEVCVCKDGFKFDPNVQQCKTEPPANEDDADVDEESPREDHNPKRSPLDDVFACDTITGKPCQFPFRRNGRLQHYCFRENEDSFEAFCPTLVNQRTLEPVQVEQCAPRASCPLLRYHTHEELIQDLKKLEQKYPEHSETFSVGQSRKREELFGIRMSLNLKANINQKARAHESSSVVDPDPSFPLRPRVKLIGNMHGNEPVGRELLIHLAKYLLKNAEEGDSRARRILQSTDLYIVPTMNPDGFARGTEGECSGGSYAAGRLNEGRRDLNRDFPDFNDWKRLQDDPDYDLFRGRQKETQHLMDWILQGHFVLSANFHDGAVLVNYPWDNYHDNPISDGIFRTPDHDEFVHIATAYSLSHRTMSNTSAACPQWGHFEDGITNGADWYPVHGGMQDFNYLFAGTMEVTVEVSCCKYAGSRRLMGEWFNNKESLLNYIEQAQRGVKGRATRRGNKIPGAIIQVRRPGETNWRASFTTSDAEGYFWKILVPGEYEVQAVMPQIRLESQVKRIQVPDDKRPVVVDLELDSPMSLVSTRTASISSVDEKRPLDNRRPTQGRPSEVHGRRPNIFNF